MEKNILFNCHVADGRNYAWFKNNLNEVAGAPNADRINTNWVFGRRWNTFNKGDTIITGLIKN